MEKNDLADSRRKIVISGINIFQAGALTIYYELLDCLVENNYWKDNDITLFVHSVELFSKYTCYFTIIECPKARRSYLYRLFYEYVYFFFYSIGKKIDIWLSLHDMTPNVIAKNRFVYCHNPLPFVSNDVNDYLHYGHKNKLVQKLYGVIYGINIKKNSAVIVQQEWLRREFRSRYGVKNVIVARPSQGIDYSGDEIKRETPGIYTFIYASYPRDFKNFEVICEAAEILCRYGLHFAVALTLNGTENEYARKLVDKYGSIPAIDWKGILDKKELQSEYEKADCLIFPSLLETWGLPITEFIEFSKEILCSDLPYAYETVGNYPKKRFFNPMDPTDLADKMMDLIMGKTVHDDSKVVELTGQVCESWSDLLDIIIIS